MSRLAAWVLAIGLVVAACAPARLERVRERRSPEPAPSDLERAFGGASDPAAAKALGNWIEQAHGAGAKDQEIGGYRVRFRNKVDGGYAPGYFDRMERASRYEPVGLEPQREAGIGVPLIGHRDNHRREAIEKWYPPEAINRAVTAVAIPGAMRQGKREVEIRLYDRLQTESVVIAGKREHLAADFTVPWAGLLAETRSLATTGLTSVLRQQTGREAGFSLMEAYDPDKTPLILVHGLFSTPLAWAELTNELWSDPAVRTRYQIWHYLYPTNAPPLYSARVMRRQLDELRAFLDPDGRDPAMQRTVVIAHSMGGLLTKSLVVDPREAFWDPIFTRPFDKLELTAEEREAMKEAFYWKPRTHVDRVIFCSVPFGGSTWAASWVGRTGRLLVAPSRGFNDFFDRIEKKNPGMWQPVYENLAAGTVNSVMSLAPKQRSMEIFRTLSVVPTTASHVIKGSRDLFVSSSSADIPGAESVLTVSSGHGSFHHPKAMEEIKRILALPPHH
ncbi:alpha/beta hydrolase [Luteolibacter sp. GHJ8]|uniref:Alpha/beta hydrolase n=1 Tax=Luteolibacter rhizosphaerae TaxID=2989719 RepID=A0ABT3G4C7_9BACT|nr:alpha/beta hydrolase [Luteolibacter rhizosphaerae]MCW1914706.1 alpha/beta hydrolase [Luteolibacter rhizosphaerae]